MGRKNSSEQQDTPYMEKLPEYTAMSQIQMLTHKEIPEKRRSKECTCMKHHDVRKALTNAADYRRELIVDPQCLVGQFTLSLFLKS